MKIKLISGISSQYVCITITYMWLAPKSFQNMKYCILFSKAYVSTYVFKNTNSANAGPISLHLH